MMQPAISSEIAPTGKLRCAAIGRVLGGVGEPTEPDHDERNECNRGHRQQCVSAGHNFCFGITVCD